MRENIITFSLVTLIHVCVGLGHHLNEDMRFIALTLGFSLVWLSMTAERVERELFSRRIWVMQALRFQSWLYRFLWGGMGFALFRAIKIFPMSLLLFAHLMSQSALDWVALYLIALIALKLRSWAAEKLSAHCTPFYEHTLSRRVSTLMSASLFLPIFVLQSLLQTRPNLRGKSLGEIAATNWSAPSEFPDPFNRIDQAFGVLDQSYDWAVQTTMQGLELSIFDDSLRWFILLVFVLHKALAAYTAGQLISGLILLGRLNEASEVFEHVSETENLNRDLRASGLEDRS